ncbi:hypothetical protein [Streptosporangium carneum]|uniref:Uncharacterized protein n=1 Tax=Streptosporangium carneum TaxID=47481 RepID=A0A9W6MBT8_9ACTN|nr:hypothetical protein [Streptosporangium carneum]GLK08397.1 hypothetical protein GCM10017600_18020 [Streptosporangium carneum]
MINVEASRLREPAAWLMIAVASTRVLIGVEQLLFSTSSGTSFAFRAATKVDDFTSPVTTALLVGAVLLAGNAGPAIDRLKLMVQVALGALGLAALFGTVGLFGALFAGETDFREKFEFFVLTLPTLALTGLALAYLLPRAASAGSAARASGTKGSAVPHGPIFPSQEQYATPQGGPAGPQGAQLPPQGAPQVPPPGLHTLDQAAQHGYAPHEQAAPQQGFHPQDQAQQQGFPPYEQGAQPGFHVQEPLQQQGFPPHDQPSHQPSHQAPHQGFHAQEQTSQHGFPGHDQSGNAYPQQAQPAPMVQLPYSPPALPPAPSSSASTGAAEGYGQAHGYGSSPNEAYPQTSQSSPGSPASYPQPGDSQPYGTQPSSYGQSPAQPASPSSAEVYTPGPYVPADAQPQAKPYESQGAAYDPPATAYDSPATAYDSPATAYDPPGYAAPAEQPQASAYTDPQLPGYTPPAEPQLPGYAQQPEQQAPFYAAQSEAQGASPYSGSDSQPRLSFDSQGQQGFPQPPENYGQPFTGYSGAEYARQTEPNLHYPAPAPDPVDLRSQQMAQAYQQAESYQQSQGVSQPTSQGGTEPQLRVPEYTSSQAGGSYDDPFGHPQAQQAPPAQQPYQQGGQWETPAETTLRFDPAAYQGDPLSGPSPSARSWDSQPIDPTAIYKPERSAQVTGEESSDRERVGPGQEQNMSWYGSDRREH